MAKTTAENKSAPLMNVTLFAGLLDRVCEHNKNLPSIGVFHGFSGLGKTFSATYGMNRHRALYIEVGESWGRAAFVRTLLTELGQPNTGTINDMLNRVITTLVKSKIPLVIDEADKLLKNNVIELVREIHDKAEAAIVLIGEEMLPHSLMANERVHNRVLDWVAAQPCVASDVPALAAIYAPGVTIGADLAELITKKSDGRARRIAVNLDRVREVAMAEGLTSIDLKVWRDRPLFTGAAPARRIA